jgi:DNA-binding NtrC family response regulator
VQGTDAGRGDRRVGAATSWHAGCVPALGVEVSANGCGPDVRSRQDVGFHAAVSAFKRHLIEATLSELKGNRTHTARALGLQRTYLLRLMRELNVSAPPPPRARRPG